MKKEWKRQTQLPATLVVTIDIFDNKNMFNVFCSLLFLNITFSRHLYLENVLTHLCIINRKEK